MEYRIPHYFNDFRCVASECKDTCCAGWAIMIDEDTLDQYKKTEGEFGERLQRSINWNEGCFEQINRRCAFLNEDDLCDIHLEAGEEMLCDTCRDYPRHMEEFEGVREGSLSLSCIEAAKLILGCEEPVRFLRLEDDVEDEEYEDFDYFLYTKLMDAREKILSFLQKRDIPVRMRIATVLSLSQSIQEKIDQDTIFEIEDILGAFEHQENVTLLLKRYQGTTLGENQFCSDMRKVFRVFQKMEVLKDSWPEYVKQVERLLYGEGRNQYLSYRKEFLLKIGTESENPEKWENWIEQLMVYFIYVYFAGAVYDDQILSKVKTGVIAILLIQELALAKWMKNGKMFSLEDMVEVAHHVSREMEHSDVNLARLEKMSDTYPVFQTDHLIRILLFE